MMIKAFLYWLTVSMPNGTSMILLQPFLLKRALPALKRWLNIADAFLILRNAMLLWSKVNSLLSFSLFQHSNINFHRNTFLVGSFQNRLLEENKHTFSRLNSQWKSRTSKISASVLSPKFLQFRIHTIDLAPMGVHYSSNLKTHNG